MEPGEGKSLLSDIAFDGDVTLVVGPEAVRLRVYSQCLRAASKVFNTMLGPHWSEGKGLTSQSPREIPLEEDDASALRTILCVLHHSNTEMPDSATLTPTEILNIAVASDKYDLAVALKYASAQWLKPRDGLGLMDMGRLMTADFLLEDTHMFAAQTVELMLHWNGSYLDLLDDDTIAQFLPFKAIYLLEQRRTQLRADVGELIATHAPRWTACPNGSKGCAWLERRNGSYLYEKIEPICRPAKLSRTKVADIIKSLQGATFEDNLRAKIRCNVPAYPLLDHEPLTHDQTVAGQLKAIRERAAICLDCARGTTPCKSKHG
ncbi:hypothetical protein BR93DRAFT_932708 [Coniochaeta sp. PMI_546]|nr:hypothetical protein BR93DRAFT_932708 [Coniochaeta sp. PMI_546]